MPDTPLPMDALKSAMAEAASAVETELDRLIPNGDGHEKRVYDAMRYACLNGGKRLRPLLVLESARLFDVPRARALRAAAAIEFVHCYSLVHDDLPAMDDDDLRRGRPTTHKQFDEATAILAGDALLTLAFEVLAHPDTHPTARCAPSSWRRSPRARARSAWSAGRCSTSRPSSTDGTFL